MLFYLTTAEHDYTIRTYLGGAGKCFQRQIVPITYEKFLAKKDVPVGHYLFSDVERLSVRDAGKASLIYKRLSESGRGLRLLNHPARVMRRYELLRNLYERGINRFNVYRLTEVRQPERFPVFLRPESEHSGALSPLLHSQEELDREIAEVFRQGGIREDILIVEYIEMRGEDALYSKHGAYMVDGVLVPCHIFYSAQWPVKVTDLVNEKTVAAEKDFFDHFPFKAQVREIFDLAGIDFGRIDYSVLDGAIQVWEINTNPSFWTPAAENPLRAEVMARYLSGLQAEFARVGDIDLPAA